MKKTFRTIILSLPLSAFFTSCSSAGQQDVACSTTDEHGKAVIAMEDHSIEAEVMEAVRYDEKRQCVQEK
jgi:hypothetical protein